MVSRTKSGKIASLVKNVALGIVTVVICLCLLEEAARTFFPLSLIDFMPRTKQFHWPGGWFRKECVEPSASRGYRFLPEPRCGINRLGLLEREFSLTKNRDTYRVLVLGDSIISYRWFGQGLEKSLTGRIAGKNRVEVISAGFPNYNSSQELAYLRDEGNALDPDLVVIGFCLNDFFTAPFVTVENDQLVAYQAESVDVFPWVNPWLFQKSSFYRLVLKRLGIFHKEHDPKQSMAEGERALLTMPELTGSVPVLVVIFPLLIPENDYIYYHRETHRRVKILCQEGRLKCYDLHGLFAAKADYLSLRTDPDDYHHPNEATSHMAAQHVSAYLIESGLVPRHRSIDSRR